MKQIKRNASPEVEAQIQKLKASAPPTWAWLITWAIMIAAIAISITCIVR